MPTHDVLQKLVSDGSISRYSLEDVDEDGNVGKHSKFCNTQRLIIDFPDGNSLQLSTWCSGSAGDSGFSIKETK